MDESTQIREFWFGPLPMSAEQFASRMALWFGGPAESAEQRAARDATLRERFGPLLERASRGELNAWGASPRRRLSLIVLLDQFPRSLFRGQRKAFAHDAQALSLALSGIQSGADAALDPAERMFFYMPLEHAESLEIQDESVAAFKRLHAEAPEELQEPLANVLQYAEAHRDIIKRFGRFPHRNRVMGRVSTPEEREFIASSDSFGQ